MDGTHWFYGTTVKALRLNVATCTSRVVTSKAKSSS
jgi:hypothetical protein